MYRIEVVIYRKKVTMYRKYVAVYHKNVAVYRQKESGIWVLNCGNWLLCRYFTAKKSLITAINVPVYRKEVAIHRKMFFLLSLKLVMYLLI